MGKPIHARPGLYAMYYERLKLIAKDYGYCLVIHGSMHRDLDLIAIPWTDNPSSEQEMIKDFQQYLTGKNVIKSNGNVQYSKMPGGRKAYSINLNRGDRDGEWVRFEDEEYYIDISVTPLKPFEND